MSLFEIGGMIFGPTEGIIEFLRRNHLLARNMDCDRLEQQKNTHTHTL